MAHADTDEVTMGALDDEDLELVRLAAAIAAGGEDAMRAQIARSVTTVRPDWVEEVILQSYLFAGFPRALNAMREWRRASARPAPARDAGEEYADAGKWQRDGERTCGTVYGQFYAPLRRNIRALHPALDSWMIVEGYGKVLSRPGLDLRRRELCIVAACAAARQERQLHSHLHGALHAGASPSQVDAVLDAVADLVSDEEITRYRSLLARVSGQGGSDGVRVNVH
jgi:4-carboxymuconolactone decarboxylase